jgi:flagellar biosynthesis/type III secretory pathway chaperone
MEKIEQLGQILQTEADLVEALAGVMVQKQQSIVRFDAGSLGTLTQREQDLLVPFQALEGERMKLAEELSGGVPGGRSSEGTPARSIHELLAALEVQAGAPVAGQAARLRSAVQRVLDLSQQNRTLMRHSLKFVRETLRLITKDHTRQLVDQRM